MPYSVVDRVFGGPKSPARPSAAEAAKAKREKERYIEAIEKEAAAKAEGFNRFWHLRVPKGVAPDDDCLTVNIGPGQPGNGVALTPGRYKLTNEFAKFLFDSDAAITQLGIQREGMDVYATFVPEKLCHGTEMDVRKPNGDTVYQ
jgi:hypothetical protein